MKLKYQVPKSRYRGSKEVKWWCAAFICSSTNWMPASLRLADILFKGNAAQNGNKKYHRHILLETPPDSSSEAGREIVTKTEDCPCRSQNGLVVYRWRPARTNFHEASEESVIKFRGRRCWRSLGRNGGGAGGVQLVVSACDS